MSLEATLYLRLASPEFYRPFVLEAQFTWHRARFSDCSGLRKRQEHDPQVHSGIVPPREGHVRLNDRVLFDSGQKIDLPSRERRVGYLFQSYAPSPT